MTTSIIDEAGKITQGDPKDDNQELGDALNSLVGEGKKFATVEDLAKGKLESDAFIQRLQLENEETRNDLQGRLSIEDFLEEMRKQKQDTPVSNPGTPNPNENGNTDSAPLDKPTMSGLSPEEVQALINSTVLERERNSRESSNKQESLKALAEAFGEGSQRVLQTKVAQLGISEEKLDELARTSPAAFKEVMGINSAQSTSGNTAPPPSAISGYPVSPSNRLNPDNPKTMKDFQEMRRQDPKRYATREIQNLIHKMGKANPQEFFA